MGATKLLARHHTGKLRHHKHTSYGALAVILVLACLPLVAASRSVAYAATSGGGGYQTYAVVAGPIPKTAPTINTPANGTHFTTADPVLVKGSCPNSTLVKIFKNGVLAGAGLCQGGAYQLQIDLFVGSNSLIAIAYNANDVASPESVPTSVQLILPGSDLNGSDQLNNQGAPAGQFYITSEVFHRGSSVGDTTTWPLIIGGGQPPYAVSVSWGDGKTDLVSRGDANRFDISHVYSQPSGDHGGFTIVIKATDQAGTASYLQLVAIVSGQTKAAAGLVSGVTGGYGHSTIIRTAWQVMLVATIVVFSFWLGEKREARLLGRTA